MTPLEPPMRYIVISYLHHLSNMNSMEVLAYQTVNPKVFIKLVQNHKRDSFFGSGACTWPIVAIMGLFLGGGHVFLIFSLGGRGQRVICPPDLIRYE